MMVGKPMEALMKSRLMVALLGCCMMAQSASAAVLVVAEARGIPLKPGATLDSTKPLTLKQGQHVTLISETGSTLKLDGPYNQLPAAGGGGGVGLNQTLAALVTQRQARAGEFGVTRGTVLASLPDPWVLDATHSGNVCVMENGTPTFWRPDNKGAAALVVAPVDHSWNAKAQWPAGQDRIAVTTDVPMRAGETYVVTFNGTESAVTLVQVPSTLTNVEMRAGWMANRRCEQQAQALLKTASP
ncbi:MAG: hypothetical protein JF627_03185 [Alphaproteobacteria bacterium]|nr:hypothetical protein [Alphaproteobacteria bacterium]